jgi:PAS domain S-box-containing protein
MNKNLVPKATQDDHEYYLLRTVAEYVDDWVYWLDEKGKLKFVSPAFESITGYSLSEFKNNPELEKDIIHPRDWALWQEHLKIHSDQTLQGELSLRIITKQGAVRWIHHKCWPVLDDEQTFRGRICSNRDITDLKTSILLEERNLELLKEEREIFTSGPTTIFKWKNAPGLPVIYVSPNVLKVFGYSSSDFLTKKIAYCDIIVKNDLKHLLNELRQIKEKKLKTFQHRPYRIQSKSGKIVWLLQHTIIKWNAQDEISHFLGYVVDITKQKQAEKQLLYHASKLELIHDLTARLNRATSFSEALETAVKGIIKILDSDRSAILLFGDDNKVHFKAWHNLSPFYRQAVDGHFPWDPADIQAEPICYPDIKEADIAPDLKKIVLDEGIRSLMFVPLAGQDRLMGKFMVYFNNPEPCTRQKTKLVQIIAQNLSAIISRFQAFERLQETEKKYREIFNNAAEGIYQSTPDGRLMTVNPAMVKMFGFKTKEEMLNLPDTSFLCWDAKERKHLIDKINKEERLDNVEVKMKRADGSLLWVLLNTRPVKDKQGHILYFEGTMVDITSRKLAEEELLKSNQKYKALNRLFRAISDNMTDMLWAKDLNKRFIFVNKAICTNLLNAKDVNEPLGKTDLFFAERERRTHPENPQYHTFGEICQDSDQVILETQKSARFDEFGNVKGKFLFLDVRKSPLFDENGNMIGIVGSARDVTEEKNILKKLKESESRYRNLFNLLPYGGEIFDKECYIKECSPRTYKMLGYRPDEMVGKKITEFLDEPSKKIFKQKIKHLLKGKMQTADVRMRKKDGTFVHVMRAAAPIRDSKGNISHILGISVDISDRIKAETALQKQLQYAQAINSVSEKIIMEKSEQKILKLLVSTFGQTLGTDTCSLYRIDTKNETATLFYTWRNPHFKNLPPHSNQYSLKMFRESAHYLLTHKVWIESHVDNINPLFLKEGSDKILHGQLSIKSLLWFPFGFESDRIFLLVLNHLQKIHKWDKAEIEFSKEFTHLASLTLLKLQLISEKEKAYNEVKRLAAVVQQTSEIIVITSPQGKIEYVNPTFEKITGYSAAEVIGQNPRIFKSGYHDQSFYQNFWDTITKGGTWNGKFVNKKKNGDIYYEEAVVFPLKNSQGKIVNFCKISRDITRLQELEEQLRQAQKMESIGTLAGGVAHDFNNLLTVINGYAEMAMLKLEKEHAVQKELEAILNAGKRAVSLTSQLLAFSRKQISNPEIVNINDIIASIDKMLRRLIGEDIRIETILKKDIPNIKADPTQIEQIFTNLVVNARDAVQAVKRPNFKKKIIIETGTASLDEDYVATHPDTKVGKYVFFTVADNGIGMDAKTKQKIFEPFFTTKEKHRGTGLGLSMVYGIVKQNNGHIFVESEPDKGTTFKIYWPITEEQAEKDKLVAEKRLLPGSETILLVEDDISVREFAVEALNTLGYKVIWASNGQTAIELVETDSPHIDLLITDIVMPEMNGEELAKRIKAIYPELKIIFVSGYTDNHLLHDDGTLGKEVNFIQKPYSIEKLAKEIRRILQEK